ncbi:MAG TPA: S9 family peptidase, partial [Chiayiivirga sp.]|nr:S9 family peptidase [Chiayiivirga sp.]
MRQSAALLPCLFFSAAMLLSGCGRETDAPPPAAESPAAPAAPPEVELITREVLFGNPERASVQISPDGTTLSWVAPREGVMNVWVAPVGDLAAARAVTADTGRGIRNHFWSYRPGTLLYVRDSGGDEDFHLFSV